MEKPRNISHHLGMLIIPMSITACYGNAVEDYGSEVDTSAEVELEPETTAPTISAVTSFNLNIPHQRQTATGCTYDNWCCGLASGNMATAYLHGVAPTASFLQQDYTYLGLNSCCKNSAGIKGTNIFQVADVAVHVGNSAGSTASCLTFAGIKTTLQAYRPVAVQLVYGNIAASRRCATFTGNHMVLVTGYNETQGVWYVNDPLCTTGGSVWPGTEFRSAVTASASGCAEAAGVVFTN